MKFLPQLTWQSSSNFFYLTNNTQLSLIPSVHPTQSSSGCIHTTSTQLSLISLSLIPLPQCKSPKPKKKKKKKIMWILTAWVQTPSLQRADIFLTSHFLFFSYSFFLIIFLTSLSRAAKVPFFVQSASPTVLLAFFVYIFNTPEFHFSTMTSLLANPPSNFGRLTDVQ